MAELDKDLRRQIDGVDPIVDDDIRRKAESFVHDVAHWEMHGFLKPSKPNPTPNRRSVSNSDFRTGEFYAQHRGVDWIGSGQDDGSFLSTISNEESQRKTAKVLRGKTREIPERHELAMADLFPKDWDGERVVYEITVRARRLTKDGQPIELQPGQPQDLASGE